MFWCWQGLMIPGRTFGGPACPEKFEEMDKELTKVIEDFTRAVDVEALRLAKKSGTVSSNQSDDRLFSVVSYRTSRARTSRARAFA